MAEIFTRFKNHDITLQRDSDDKNWYIRVRAPSGLYAYDGYWRDSACKTAKEALQEAKEGAMLVKPLGVKVAGDGQPCPNTHDPHCGWPDCLCRTRGVTLPADDQLREQAAKVCHYLGSAYDGEPRRVIEALVQRAYGVKEVPRG